MKPPSVWEVVSIPLLISVTGATSFWLMGMHPLYAFQTAASVFGLGTLASTVIWLVAVY